MSSAPKIPEIAERIRALRDMCGFTEAEMAEATGISEEEYARLESGTEDFGFTFLYKCADKLGVDMIEIITGSNPRLTDFSIVRSGKNKISEPFLVHAPFLPEEQNKEIALSHHEGQEYDYILSGTLRFSHEGRVVNIGPGDSLYYDSGKGHGMIATSREGCTFLAIVMRKGDED